jgi:hypothetical protein
MMPATSVICTPEIVMMWKIRAIGGGADFMAAKSMA